MTYFQKTASQKWSINEAKEEFSKIYNNEEEINKALFETLNTIATDINAKPSTKSRAERILNELNKDKENVSNPDPQPASSEQINTGVTFNQTFNSESTVSNIVNNNVSESKVKEPVQIIKRQSSELNDADGEDHTEKKIKLADSLNAIGWCCPQQPLNTQLFDDSEEMMSPSQNILNSQSSGNNDQNVRIWDLWKDLLESINLSKEAHVYSLEKLNIVQFGQNIGSATTREYYTKELVNGTPITVADVPDAYITNQTIHNKIFDGIVESEELGSQALAESASAVYGANDSFLKFAVKFYQLFNEEMLTEDPMVYISESEYNSRLVFPIMYALSRTLSQTNFITGETKLNAVTKELWHHEQDSKHFYNADGIFKNKTLDFEVAFIETAGKFGKFDIQKETNDYIKSAYGLLAIIHSIGREYNYGDFTLLKKLPVYFLQVTAFKIRLWEFNIAEKEIYCIKCIGSVEIPTKRRACEEKIRKLTSLLWLLQDCIKKSYDSLELFINSHKKNTKKVSRKEPGYEDVKDVTKYFKMLAEVKLPEVYMKYAKQLNMLTFSMEE